MRKALLALGMVALLAGSAWAQVGTVVGVVVDADEVAVEEARVSLWQDDACVTYVVSDEFGAFTLADIPEGLYDLKAGKQHVGHALIEGVEVLDGEVTDVGTVMLEGESQGNQKKWQHQYHQGE